MPPANPHRRRNNQRTRLPLFARSHPLLYRLFLISAQLTTPLVLLTIASTSSIVQRKLSSSPSSSPPSASSGQLTWRFPFRPTSISVTNSGIGAGVRSVAVSINSITSSWALQWKKVTVWLWYLSVWCYVSRPALIGSTVVWALKGMAEGEGGREEDELGRDGGLDG
jgi:hypothetical protein